MAQALSAPRLDDRAATALAESAYPSLIASDGLTASVPIDEAFPVKPKVGPPFRRAAGNAKHMRAPRDAEAAGNNTWQCLCLAEISNFAAVRRHVGRTRADQLVRDAAARIAACVAGGQPTIVGRATIELTFEANSLAIPRGVLAAIEASFEAPFVVAGEAHRLNVLLGLAVAPTDSCEDVWLAEQAEGALDEARAENCAVLRDLSSASPAFDRIVLARELASAIRNGEMFLQYQPKVHVRRQDISSAEALVRWEHPTRGLIMPADFIPMAEEINEICGLTLWTLDQVIADQRTLAEDGHDLTIFINISGQLLADHRFVEQACAIVRQGGAKIGFEITETSVIRDPQIAIANLQRFADVGITIAIDDYGAGLSSLTYLKQLPARELKIDKMFILQLTSSNRDPLIVRSTIDLAHALDMEVTAEGVETPAAMALLAVMGCDMVQGYLISRPISIDPFRRFLRQDVAATIEEVRQPMFKRPASFWKRA